MAPRVVGSNLPLTPTNFEKQEADACFASMGRSIRMIAPGSRPKLFCRSAQESPGPGTVLIGTFKRARFGIDLISRQANAPPRNGATALRTLKEGNMNTGLSHDSCYVARSFSYLRDKVTAENSCGAG